MPFKIFQRQYTVFHKEHTESHRIDAINLESFYSASGLRHGNRGALSHAYTCTHHINRL